MKKPLDRVGRIVYAPRFLFGGFTLRGFDGSAPGPLLPGVAEGQNNFRKTLYFWNENPINIVFLYK